MNITGLNFQPDFAWIKSRSAATDHSVYDSTRGVQTHISTNLTDADATSDNGLTAFNSDGFTLGTLAQVNTNTVTYVAWMLKKIAAAGFDIVSYTGNATNRTIAHSLGVIPEFMIVKNRSAAGNWQVYHKNLTSAAYSIQLNATSAQSSDTTVWNSTAPTSSVFSVGTSATVNGNTNNIIAYLFAGIDGFSKFGSYTGNGASDGPFVYCGFRPRWIMIKNAAQASTNWIIFDTARDVYNQMNNHLGANLSSAENFQVNESIDVVSNGFKIRNTNTDINSSGYTLIFSAFSEAPMKYSRSR